LKRGSPHTKPFSTSGTQAHKSGTGWYCATKWLEHLIVWRNYRTVSRTAP
jgi:hypothetical protein